MFLSKLRTPLYQIVHLHRQHRRKSWTSLLTLILAVVVLTIASHYNSSASAVDLAPTSSPHITYKVSASSGGSPTTPVVDSTSTPVAIATPKVLTPQSCTPDTSYSLPSPIDLTGQSDGLTLITDPTSFYQVYGNNSSQIRAQLQQCGPKSVSPASTSDNFAAETSYKLTWQYNYFSDENGLCRVANARVGLHLNMVLPQWQASGSANADVASSWQGYINSLTTHENGHAAIDKQYASQLLADLQSYQPSDCGSIKSNIQAKMAADVAALDAANDAYDAATNHGATQGAVLP